MLNQAGNGIICDYCGSNHDTDFTYYSFDVYKVTVANSVKDIGTDIILSADLCSDCMDLYADRVKAAYKPPKKGVFTCDVSGQEIPATNLVYYRCLVTKAVVALSKAGYTCKQCKTPKSGERCKCGSNVFVRQADPHVDKNFLELNFSQLVYDQLAAYLDETKKRMK
jgi:hypothetical protein